MWEGAQGTEIAQGDSFGPDESAVAEVLNLAWGGHEIISDWSRETMDFFDSVSLTNEKDRTKSIGECTQQRLVHQLHFHTVGKVYQLHFHTVG